MSTRGLIVRRLDLVALAVGVVLLRLVAGSPDPSLSPAAIAGLVLWVPLILCVRALVDEAPSSTDAPSERPSMGRVVVMGVGGAMATAVGGLTAWGLVHPHTDYPTALRLAPPLVAAAVGLGLLTGALIGFLARSTPGSMSAADRVATHASCIAVLAAVALWKPADGWSFSAALSPATGILVGAVVLLVIVLAFRALIGRGTPLRVAGAVMLAVLPVLVLGYASRPLTAGAADRPDWPRGVLLITIDTLRADHLGAYGYRRDTSPAIDSFARSSVLFERAYAPMPTTDPSHVAILTGLLPRTTGVTKNGLSIALPDVSSLASWFRDRGYRTGAVTSRAHLDPEALALPGFQSKSVPDHATPATEAYRRATSWIERNADAPFFLWVHFWDPHAPYAPPAGEAFRYTDARGLPFVHGIAPYVPRERPHTQDEIEYATALYDAEIRHADHWVGRLFEETQERIGAVDLLTVLTSDHGETLGELDRDLRYAFDHGKVLISHELHVPLVVSWPGRLQSGKRVAAPVPTAGITPTITALLGDELAGDVGDFANLLLDDTVVPPEPLLVERRSFAEPAQLGFLAAPELGIIDGRFLYVENPERGRFLEDLVPEAAMQATSAEATAARLAAGLRELSRELAPAADATDPVDQDKLERLRSLGYIE